ncbi:MAG TPA: heparan-alpha-glucosaminide N-acetyltransferase domain-containing protein [Candidatus Dormibacteraeota bacterium]|nr:heparan-alpha-glucosaminide N-acetyltransferase domain-containing protein [Candidatus Dormibacteraeota bacterium]
MQAGSATVAAVAAPPADAATDSITGLAKQGRVRAFDLARGLAVVFMIGVHVLWHWGAPDTWTTPIGQVISFLGGPTAAPVFMFLMGASLAFSSRTSFRSLAVRGLWLLWLGYLLNFLRGVIPAYLGLSTGLVTADQIAPFTLPWLATTVDVHHMAGLSLIALAALRMAARPNWIWVAVAAIVVVTGPFVRGLSFGTPLLDAPLTPILGGAPNVYYAVVPWIGFPLVGAVYGSLVARTPDRTRVFRLGALVGAALCAIGIGLFVVSRPSFDVTTYWRMPPSYFVAITGLVLVWLYACDVAVRYVRENRVFGFLYGWSSRVIAIYFTHWLIVGWGVGIFGFRDQPLAGALFGIVVAIVATALLSRYAVGLETPRWLERLARDRRAAGAEPSLAAGGG